MRSVLIKFESPDINGDTSKQIGDKLAERLYSEGKIKINRVRTGANHIALGDSSEDAVHSRVVNRIPIDPDSDRARNLGRSYLETKKLTRGQAEILFNELRLLKNLGLTGFSVEISLNNGSSYLEENFTVPASGTFSPSAIIGG